MSLQRWMKEDLAHSLAGLMGANYQKRRYSGCHLVPGSGWQDKAQVHLIASSSSYFSLRVRLIFLKSIGCQALALLAWHRQPERQGQLWVLAQPSGWLEFPVQDTWSLSLRSNLRACPQGFRSSLFHKTTDPLILHLQGLFKIPQFLH